MLHSISPVRLPDLSGPLHSFNQIKTDPPISQLIDHTSDRFKIMREGVAEIEFLQKVDLTHFDINNDLVLEPCFVNFYPQYTSKPLKYQKAKGIHVPAQITMYGVWPASNHNEMRKRISVIDSPEAFHFTQVLQLFCHAKESTFTSYNPLSGVFIFEVNDICNGPYDIPIGN